MAIQVYGAESVEFKFSRLRRHLKCNIRATVNGLFISFGKWNEPNRPLRAFSHEPGTVNYPVVMIATGQALPRIYVMI